MKTLQWIRRLSIIGILLSLYLTYAHYTPSVLESSFCDYSDFISCSTVSKSSYATFSGIPVALIGVIGFSGLLYLSLGRGKYHRVILFYLSLGALLFMLYLLIIELFVLKAICLFCVFTFIDVAVLFGIAATAFGKESVQFVKEIKVE